MSDALYRTRLRWTAGKGGVAKLRGREVWLPSPPDLGSGPVWYLDYIPEVGIREVALRSIDKRRDMLPDEIQAADALLRTHCS